MNGVGSAIERTYQDPRELNVIGSIATPDASGATSVESTCVQRPLISRYATNRTAGIGYPARAGRTVVRNVSCRPERGATDLPIVRGPQDRDRPHDHAHGLRQDGLTRHRIDGDRAVVAVDHPVDGVDDLTRGVGLELCER